MSDPVSNPDPAPIPVVPLVSSDTAAVAALQQRCFTEGWSEASVAGLLATAGTYGFLARVPGLAPSGFVIARALAGEAEILSLAVSAEARRQGVGATLLTHALVRAAALGAETVFLEVAAANQAARALYAAIGFLETGLRRNYYRKSPDAPLDGGDAVIATLALAAWQARSSSSPV